MKPFRTLCAALALLLLLSVPRAQGAETNALKPESVRIILDTDIGDDVDDAYALALACSLPNVKLLGVTTAFGQTRERAEIAAKLLQVMGRRDVPVFAGRRGEAKIRRQYDWAKGFRSPAIKDTEAVEFIRQEVERAPGQVTLVAIGPLTNVGDLLTRYPDVKSKLKAIVIMGGAVHVGYNNQRPPTPEWNIRCDPAAARAVYESGIPLTMAGLEVTAMMQLDAERQKQLFAAGSPKTDALAALTNLWGDGVPTLFDPVAVAWAAGFPFAAPEKRRVRVENDGLTRIVEGAPSVSVLVSPRKEEFLNWYVATVGVRESAK